MNTPTPQPDRNPHGPADHDTGLIGYAIAWPTPSGTVLGTYVYPTPEEAARANDLYARPTWAPSTGVSRLQARVVELREAVVAVEQGRCSGPVAA